MILVFKLKSLGFKVQGSGLGFRAPTVVGSHLLRFLKLGSAPRALRQDLSLDSPLWSSLYAQPWYSKYSYLVIRLGYSFKHSSLPIIGAKTDKDTKASGTTSFLELGRLL